MASSDWDTAGYCTDNTDSADCQSLQAEYEACEGDPACAADIQEKARQLADGAGVVDASGELDSEISLLGAENIKNSNFLSLIITLAAEVISGLIRVTYAVNSFSAWIHFLASMAIMGCLIGFENHHNNLIRRKILKYSKDKVEDGEAYLEGDTFEEMKDNLMRNSAAQTLKASSSSNQEFADTQMDVLEAQIEVMQLMEDQSNTMKQITQYGAVAFTSCIAIAIGEILTCGSSGNGCVYTAPKKKTLFHALLKNFLSPMIATTLANNATDVMDDEAAGETDHVAKATSSVSGATSLIMSLIGIGADQFANIALKKGGKEAAKKAIKAATTKEAKKELSKWAGKKAASKTELILRSVSFALSAGNLYWITHLYKNVTETYSQRKSALETLKTQIKTELTETQASVTDAGGTGMTDQRGIDNAFNESQDFMKGNCVDGDLSKGEGSFDQGCKTNKTSKFAIPSSAIGSMAGFSTGSISTNPVDYAEALDDLLNKGKGINNALDKVGGANMAVNQRVFKNLLKRAKKAVAQQTGNPNAFDEMVAQQKRKDQEAYKAFVAAVPKSLFDQLNTSLLPDEKPSKEKNQFERKAKKEQMDFTMPTIPEEDFEEFSEDGVHTGELAAVNDDFSDLDTNVDDIVKNDGVSIFKVLEIRYKKSAYPRFFKRKTKTKKAGK